MIASLSGRKASFLHKILVTVDLYHQLSKIGPSSNKPPPPIFLMKLLQRVLFFQKYAHSSTCSYVKQEAPKKWYCARGGTHKKGGHHLLLLHKQTHDKRNIEESLHAYINRARLTVCGGGCIFERSITTLKNMPSPLREGATKLYCPWEYFERLWYM